MSYNIVAHEGMTLIEGIYSREQRAKRACLHAHLATVARHLTAAYGGGNVSCRMEVRFV